MSSENTMLSAWKRATGGDWERKCSSTSSRKAGFSVIPTYSEYIHRFLPRRGEPGEHHFVAVYLLPKVMKIYDCVPDFVNPDGTKKIIGDIVYYKDGQHHFGIEAKLKEIRLTAAEFNNWILLTNSAKHPDVFVAIGTSGLILQAWSRFRAVYRGLKQGLLPLKPLRPKKYAPQLGKLCTGVME
jgi:hypothetical protein